MLELVLRILLICKFLNFTAVLSKKKTFQSLHQFSVGEYYIQYDTSNLYYH